jgi:uncharacterized repeat protein (TIGR03803 family)
MKNLSFYQLRPTVFLILLCAALAIASPAQTFTKLADFNLNMGANPGSPLTQGLDGNFYGTAGNYGVYGAGAFIKVTPSGTLSYLYEFCLDNILNCPDGAYPSGAVALGVDGDLYGTTAGNLEAGIGSIYKITPAGSLTTLTNFNSCTANVCSASPRYGVTLARTGDFYGPSLAGPNSPAAFDDLIFAISSSGKFNNVLIVCPDQICPVDAGPSGTLLQASDGDLVGPGPGGANGWGAIYKITPSGTPTVIYSFCDNSTCHDGEGANSPLANNIAGDFFGTNTYGGAGANCTLSQGCGTAFKVTPGGGGALIKLHDFCSAPGCADGSTPNALIQALDGNFYGTTSGGGNSEGDGTVFKLSPGGLFSVLHRFSGTDGATPITALLQATDGNLYGTTSHGGTGGGGTIFRISLGLPPFVKTVQNAGAVGSSVIILGSNLTGSTSVTFDGTAATFSVVSDTEITATVPAGAFTGEIQVTTPSATLSSNIEFVVLP